MLSNGWLIERFYLFSEFEKAPLPQPTAAP